MKATGDRQQATGKIKLFRFQSPDACCPPTFTCRLSPVARRLSPVTLRH